MSNEAWIAAERRFVERAADWGVSPLEELRKRSGLEFLRAIASGELPSPPIGRTLNFFLHEVDEGRVVFQGEAKAEFYNPIGSIHGGWACTLLDSCMACAVQTTLKAGTAYTTLELKINLVRALGSDTGPVRAEGRVVHAGRQVATAEG
ncbi:MAG: PaaI family thioesterase, partial [Burkholderiales bacterium]